MLIKNMSRQEKYKRAKAMGFKGKDQGANVHRFLWKMKLQRDQEIKKEQAIAREIRRKEKEQQGE